MKCPKCRSTYILKQASYARDLSPEGKILPALKQPNFCRNGECEHKWWDEEEIMES